jgi:predicted transcriptional regulator
MKILIAVRIEKKLVDKLKLLAAKEDERSVSYMVRKAVEQFVESHPKRKRSDR